MDLRQLLSVGAVAFILALTIFSWRGFANNMRREGFTSIMTNTPPATAATDAEAAYKTLLQFIRSDYGRGQHFVRDFGARFFADGASIRDDLTVGSLLDNYQSPVQSE